MLLQENVALKKELSRRAWRRSPVGRTGFIAMLVLFVLAPLAGMMLHGLLVSVLNPWEYDSAGLLGFDLVAVALFIITGIAVRFETWKRCNMDIGMRINQEIRIEGTYMTYTYRLKGDRYHGAGGTIMAVVNLAEGQSIMGMDPQAGVIAFRGDVRQTYTAVLGGGGTPASVDQIPLVEELHIPNCFIPDLYQTLLPFYR